jgi:hypothetical protein
MADVGSGLWFLPAFVEFGESIPCALVAALPRGLRGELTGAPSILFRVPKGLTTEIKR